MRATFVFTLLSLAACSEAPQPEARSTATSGSAARPYIAVPGTRVALAPPEGFEPSAKVQGFERADGAAKLGVFELPMSFADALADARESWSQGGFTLRREEPTEVCEHAGRLFEYEREANGVARHGWMALVGDESGALLLVAECDARARAALERLLRECLLGARWERATDSALAFELRPAEGLVLVSDEGSSKAYVAVGAPSPVPLGTSFLLASSSTEPLDDSRLEQACTESLAAALATVGATIARVERSGRAELSGLRGWELVARVRDPRLEGEWLGYAALVPRPQGQLRFLGHASPTGAARALAQFELTVRSLRLR